MVQGGWLEDRILLVVLHNDAHASQDEHVGCREANKTVANEAEEMIGTRHKLAGIFRESVQLPLGIRAEVDERDQEAADHEERVHAEGSVGDRLKDELLLDHLPQLHVVRVLEHDDARVAQDDPGHGDSTQPVDGGNGVAAHALITNGFEVRHHGEAEQQLFPNAQLVFILALAQLGYGQVLVRVVGGRAHRAARYVQRDVSLGWILGQVVCGAASRAAPRTGR